MKKEDIIARAYTLHLKKTRDKIIKEQGLFIEILKDELINQPIIGQTKEQKDTNKKRLLNFVHRYVFLQKLQPLDSDFFKVKTVVLEPTHFKNFIKYFINVRNFFGNFLKFKTPFIILSALILFSLEFLFSYFSLLRLMDVTLTLTFQDIINKIPPFF